MSSTAPPTRPSTATTRNGTSTQVSSSRGQRTDRIGGDAVGSVFDEPASSSPNTSSTIGATAPPNAVQPTTPRLDARRGR